MLFSSRGVARGEGRKAAKSIDLKGVKLTILSRINKGLRKNIFASMNYRMKTSIKGGGGMFPGYFIHPSIC